MAQSGIAGLAIAGADGVVRTYDPASGVLLHSWQSGPGENRALAYSPSGETLAVAGSDVRLFGSAGEPRIVLARHSLPINAVDFSRDGRLLSSASDDGTVSVIDLTQLHEQMRSLGLSW